MKPRVSYVIPAYNAVHWITECLESIFKGNFQKGDEVIVIDDGSSDGTGELVEKLSKYPFQGKIRLLENGENIGCPASRNVGIKEARNPLIMNVDSDNILTPNLVPRLVNCLVAEKAHIVHAQRIQFFWKRLEDLKHHWWFPEGQFRLEDMLSGHITPAPAGNFLHTKEGWEEVGGYWCFDDGTHEAWAYTFKRLVFGHKFFIMPDSYYFHRFGVDGLWARPTWKQQSADVSNQIITPYVFMLEPDDRDYILDNKDTWFQRMDKRPLRVYGRPPGRCGKRVATPMEELLPKEEILNK